MSSTEKIGKNLAFWQYKYCDSIAVRKRFTVTSANLAGSGEKFLGFNVIYSPRGYCRRVPANPLCVSFLPVVRSSAMPPKSKRQKQREYSLEVARDAKRKRDFDEGPSTMPEIEVRNASDTEDESAASALPARTDEAPDSDDEVQDPSFDLDDSLMSDREHMTENFCEEWVTHLDFEDRASLGLFLAFQLKSCLGKGMTEAAEISGMMIGTSDRTIREWQAAFFDSGGAVPESRQGCYQRSGILWTNEELNRKATKFIRDNAAVKGKPNLTVGMFCQWVNEDLLPNATLEPGFPRSIALESGRKWMHKLGFEVVHAKKGTFIDGHERDDVVAYRKVFLRKMVALGFLNASNAPTEEAQNALPKDLECPSQAIIDKTVIFFHDESTFQCNDDQSTLWATKETTIIRPKSKGTGIMVSDFICEQDGYLSFTAEEYEAAKASDPTIKLQARQFLEYGESREGYWTGEKFMQQIELAVKIAEFKYPKRDGWRHVWLFDHSSCHAAMADDALDVTKMNVNPGGKQRKMRDGWWNGKPHPMNYAIGIPKGLRAVLQERGVDTSGMNADTMRATLGSHLDFKEQKTRVEDYLHERGHIAVLLPKYHCELNPIERVWAQAKRFTRAYCKYTIHSLRANLNPALDSVSLDSIQNHFRKVRHYMFAYLEGVPGGSDLEKLVKRYKTEIASHRRISAVQ